MRYGPAMIAVLHRIAELDGDAPHPKWHTLAEITGDAPRGQVESWRRAAKTWTREGALATKYDTVGMHTHLLFRLRRWPKDLERQ